MSDPAPVFELRELQYFLAVAEHLSLDTAAETLVVNRPALGVAMARLESAIGVPLLFGEDGSLELTPAGVAFRRSAEFTLASLDRGVLRARQAAGLGSPVRFSMPYEANETGRAILRELGGEAPEVHVEQLHGGSRFAQHALLSGAADVALGGAFALPATIAAEHVRDERLTVWMPAGHRLAGAGPLTLASLAGEAVWLPEPRLVHTWTAFVRGLFARAGVDVEFVRGDGTRDGRAQLVAAGRCVAISVESDDVTPGVVARPLQDRQAVYPWSVLYLADDPGPGVAVLLAAARVAGARHDWRPAPDRRLRFEW